MNEILMGYFNKYPGLGTLSTVDKNGRSQYKQSADRLLCEELNLVMVRS